jgi:D-alanyl-lipoteichoic acid acyltransferase DltB (MBOAT superfamily)
MLADLSFDWLLPIFSSENIRNIFIKLGQSSTREPWFFTDFTFLATFGFFLLIYAVIYKRETVRKVYIILFSLFFYYKSSGLFLGLFVLMIISDFLFALLIQKAERIKRKIFLLLGLAYSLSFLLYFKYTNFFIENFNLYLGTHFTPKNLFLPIGISFYTFQSISYIIDVYRKEITASKNIIDYTFYMTFFPHLVAGPIVRAKDFLPQIYNYTIIDGAVFKESFFRIIIGLIKKLFIADYLAKYADLVYASPGAFSGGENLLSMYAYTFQIYFDFSGYSDIALGLALLLGYRLKENFDNPYASADITTFWRKWHISLSSWLRDYIYIPLGGNRKGEINRYVFLMLTMLIGGFWHGASWTFVFWGLAHGLALAAHKLWSGPGAKKPATELSRIGRILKAPKYFFSVLLTFHFVALCWIFFRANTFDIAFQSILSIFNKMHYHDFVGFWMARKETVIMLLTASLIVFFPSIIKQKLINIALRLPVWSWLIIMLLAMQLIIQFKDSVVQPFIYFQF